MEGITCDMCGKSLLVDEEVRYVGELKLYAAYDTMEVTSEDLARRDIRKEIRRLIKEMEERDAVELEEEVYLSRAFDLCPSCRKELLSSLPPGGWSGQDEGA